MRPPLLTPVDGVVLEGIRAPKCVLTTFVSNWGFEARDLDVGRTDVEFDMRFLSATVRVRLEGIAVGEERDGFFGGGIEGGEAPRDERFPLFTVESSSGSRICSSSS